LIKKREEGSSEKDRKNEGGRASVIRKYGLKEKRGGREGTSRKRLKGPPPCHQFERQRLYNEKGKKTRGKDTKRSERPSSESSKRRWEQQRS